MEIVDTLKKEIKEGTFILGLNQVVKGLREGSMKKVYHAKTISEEMLVDLKHYTELAGVPLTLIPVPSDELGVLCKKPFSVTVLGIK